MTIFFKKGRQAMFVATKGKVVSRRIDETRAMKDEWDLFVES